MRAATKEIFITTQFEGFHCWPDAPDEVGFLRDRHRHMFHVKVEVPVTDSDREIEFILFKRDVENWIFEQWGVPAELGTLSCEHIAARLGAMCNELHDFSWVRVTVSEDGENGAVVTVT